MEWLNQLADILSNNWEQVLLIIGTPIVSGVSLWKIGNIIVRLVQNWTAKKYTAKQKEYTERVEKAINSIKVELVEEVKGEIKGYADSVMNTFNELQEKTQQAKQKIYNDIFNKSMEVQEIVQDVVQDVKEEVEQVAQEVEEEQPEPQQEEEVKKVVDLL